MKYHRTKLGEKISLSELDDDHLANIIKWIDRKSADGLKVVSAGGYPGDYYYDEDWYYGEEARRRLNYYDYIAEYNRRTL